MNNNNLFSFSGEVKEIICKNVSHYGALGSVKKNTSGDDCFNFTFLKISYYTSTANSTLTIHFSPQKSPKRPVLEVVGGANVIKRPLQFTNPVGSKSVVFGNLNANQYYYFTIPIEGEVFSATMEQPNTNTDEYVYLRTAVSNNYMFVNNT